MSSLLRPFDEMKELLQILLGLAAVAAVLWLYLKAVTFLNDLCVRSFGRSLRYFRPKVEIQTLFGSNGKDRDQI